LEYARGLQSARRIGKYGLNSKGQADKKTPAVWKAPGGLENTD
jgi:hypothetical protein